MAFSSLSSSFLGVGDGATSSSASTGSRNSSSSVADQRLRLCELCAADCARVFCAADEARLCWACDLRIHSANFLVARHARVPLCPFCGSIRHPSSPCLASWCRGRHFDSAEESKVQADDGSCCSAESDDDEEEQSSSCCGELPACRRLRTAAGRGSADAFQRRCWGAVACLINGEQMEEGCGDSEQELHKKF